jgi:hypothetical protein
LNRSAATAPSAIVPEDYGVQDYSYTVIPASDFRPLDSGTSYTTSLVTGSVSRTGGGPYFGHVITLPAGAILADVTTYITDNIFAFNVTAYLYISYRASDTGANPLFAYYSAAQSSGAPGDTALVIPWNSTVPAQYDVASTGVLDDVAWMVVVSLDALDNSTSFNSVRLKWRRQVSPAPATATFNDVPTTHLFYQYIEALAASGITAGCGGGNYCPDAAVTRGQMAVFLSKALGLHWAP